MQRPFPFRRLIKDEKSYSFLFVNKWLTEQPLEIFRLIQVIDFRSLVKTPRVAQVNNWLKCSCITNFVDISNSKETGFLSAAAHCVLGCSTALNKQVGTTQYTRETLFKQDLGVKLVFWLYKRK